jgi:DnaD/phage-associated family protein
MNYLREINAFYDWLETNSISSSAIALWHALMAINNKCGWITEFAVAISVLEVKTGLKRRTLERARNELEQKGRLTWKTRKGNQSATYTIVSLIDAQYDVQTDAQNNKGKSLIGSGDAQTVVQVDAQYDVQCVAQPDAINKLNKTKLNKKNNINNTSSENEIVENELALKKVTRLYEQNIGLVNGPSAQELIFMSEEYSYELIEEAFRIAVERKKVSLNYIKTILRNWKNSNINSISDLEAYKANRFKKLEEKKEFDWENIEVSDEERKKAEEFLDQIING